MILFLNLDQSQLLLGVEFTTISCAYSLLIQDEVRRLHSQLFQPTEHSTLRCIAPMKQNSTLQINLLVSTKIY